jgi:hypothetical protein
MRADVADILEERVADSLGLFQQGIHLTPFSMIVGAVRVGCAGHIWHIPTPKGILDSKLSSRQLYFPFFIRIPLNWGYGEGIPGSVTLNPFIFVGSFHYNVLP